MKNQPLPAAVQEQIDRFYRDYPLKNAQDLAERYQKLVLSEDYRSASLGRTESRMVERSRPRSRGKQ
jgi:hypothetical protein